VPDDRLTRQIAFLVEADKLKTVLRRTPLVNASRFENSAEHSWHLLLAAMVMREHAAADIDLWRVFELLVVHDLVEIDAGDTFAYDLEGQKTKADREQAAADRLFGLLPADQAVRFRELWEEFEARETTASRFANAMDRFQPFLINAHADGGSWKTHELTRGQVIERMRPIESAMPDVWPLVVRVIEAFCAAGIIRN
jgi:5'-deoxynucleotidase YfbR-like HD superfamily hydrolase